MHVYCEINKEIDAGMVKEINIDFESASYKLDA